MKIQNLDVGPIVGYVEPKRARIWGRGRLALVDERPMALHGIVRFRKLAEGPEREGEFKHLVYKLNPSFDLTGLAILEGLEPATCYEYQTGYIIGGFPPSPETVAELEEELWEDIETHEFRTASDDATAERTLVFGSCRYLLFRLGTVLGDARGDKTFRTINKLLAGEFEAEGGADQLLMIGDQIYADDLRGLGPSEGREDFYTRYRTAFSQPHLAALMARIPTYMTLDDHEIEDNWPEHADRRDWMIKYPTAIHAYQAYQASHSPVFEVEDGRLQGTPEHWWYEYSDGCCSFFVLDARTERVFEGERRMLSEVQEDALFAWLKDDQHKDKVKVIVSSVPIAPESGSKGENQDKWSGFPQQRDRLLDHIANNSVTRVLFLSGDVHASMSTELVRDDLGLNIVSVVSSPFFWPYPHPLSRHFRTEGSVGGWEMRGDPEVYRDENFVRLKIDLERVVVEIWPRKGKEPKSTRTHQFRLGDPSPPAKG